MGSSRRQQTSYWDQIREASGIVIPPNEEHDYWQLQRNQEAIGWDNLLQGKFAKDWRKLNGVHNRKLRAKITEATQTVTDLYSLQSMIMPQHKSKYFAMPLEEMVKQSASRMLAWVTR